MPPITSLRAPRLPVRIAAIMVVVAVATAACASGSGPGWTYAPTAASTPAPSAAPSESAAPGDSATPASPGPSTASPGDGAGASNPAASAAAGGVTLSLTAQNIAYDKQSLQAPANTPFTISFNNQDQGVPHNVSIHKDSPTGQELFKGDIITGPAQASYSIPALPAGTYGFVCSVHPNMTGTLTVQ